ncbi:hypothetical protein G647_09051 [Cladophialophora carrionii CBS 160.54]|uniref:Uncharacterized protein n=1 Tax=Cladophialophora carrionii CBS 160.54 TaxID=1279043 RepID=V9D058_9EURO|nr:uncharacterized protein G647_09051 [Cladophialophora carrionii CBS 160.54]ETI20036.1 hypothetical protein G647_09051 [Cladophialophora carrionii CBS 160.54]
MRVHFLPVRPPNVKTTQREVELDQAEARVHAATVSSRWRQYAAPPESLADSKGRNSKGKRTGGRTRSARSRHLTARHFDKENRPGPIQEDTALRVQVAYPVIERGKSGRLDPFIRLAGEDDLSRRDRDLIHFYLTTGPAQYGTSDRPSFCPTRDCTVPQLATNAVYVRWLAFVAEMMTISMTKTDTLTGKMAIAARRATNYRLMRRMMADADNWDRTSTVFSLIVAAISEFRAGDASVAKKHLAMATGLLERKRGLMTIQEMEFTEGVIILYAFTSLQLPILETSASLAGALERWRTTTSMLKSEKMQGATVPGRLITELALPTRPQWGPQLACLHILNCILSRCSEEDGQEYVENLTRMTSGSRGTGKLAPVAIFFMLCSCAERMGWWHARTAGPLTTWETIELIALMYFAPRKRVDFMAFLASRIHKGPMLDLDINEVEAEIVLNWELKHGNHGGAFG